MSVARTQLPDAVFPEHTLTIGIVGFGNFGQFLGKAFAAQGHHVVGVSRGDYSNAAAAINCEYVRSYDHLMDCRPQVVIFCTSIVSFATVLDSFPLHRLSGVLVADALSVKEYPRNVLVKCLPKDADIVCTHPMFGPESGQNGWNGLPFVYEVVRDNPSRTHVRDQFLELWKGEGCRMVKMTCTQHDAYAASTQFITHTTGRMLAELDIQPTPIDTKGYESLLGVMDTTVKDSFDLYYGLFKYNPKARTQLDKLEDAIAKLRAQLKEADQEAEDRKSRTPKLAIVSSPVTLAADQVLADFTNSTYATAPWF